MRGYSKEHVLLDHKGLQEYISHPVIPSAGSYFTICHSYDFI